MDRLPPILRLLVLYLVLASPAVSQSRQLVSLQGSGAVLFPSAEDPNFQSETRLGYEVQARLTFSRFSIGAGYQRSTVSSFVSESQRFTAALQLAFVEPRYVVTASGGLAFYLAGRLGLGDLVCSEQCAAEGVAVTYGGGGGFLMKVTRTVALDIGGQYFRHNHGDGYAMARVGLGIGL